jgi:hypothetical protein
VWKLRRATEIGEGGVLYLEKAKKKLFQRSIGRGYK